MTAKEWLAGGVLAVVIAAVVAPRVGDAGERERIEALGAQLGLVRNAIQRYYHEHGETYPGNPTDATEDPAALFVRQLAGAPARGGGVYLEGDGLPASPVAEDGVDPRSLAVVSGDVYPAPDGTTAWLYNRQNGRFVANHTRYVRY